jgi:ABC-2 type transport system permease protein
MGTVFRLTLRQLAGRGRLVVMTILAALPVLVALLVVSSSGAPSVQEFETFVLSAMLAGTITPLVVLAIAAVSFANEVEDRTLANLTLSPLPRWQIVVPKLLAALAIAMPFVGGSAMLAAHVAYLGDLTATVAVTVAALVAVALYAAAFTWLGLVTTQAIGIGLLYIVIWEGLLAGLVSGVRVLSIRHYAIAVMHGLDDRRFAWSTHPGLPVTVALCLVLFAGFAWLSVRRLRRMDVP